MVRIPEAKRPRTDQIVHMQIEAMGDSLWEIGLLKVDATNEPSMMLRTWDRQTLLRSVWWLRYQNENGRHIFIRPSGENRLTLLDDLNSTQVARLFREGYEPAALVQTSPANYQAWLKHPQPLSRELGTAVARLLAREFEADLGSADWRHFGRLSGFVNAKAKHRRENGSFPFVSLEGSSGVVFSKAHDVFCEATALLEIQKREVTARSNFFTQHPIHTQVRSIDDYRRDPRYGGDGNRIDLAYAIHALGCGRNPSEVAADLKSRDLTHKGNEARQDQYLARTIKKALQRVRVIRSQERL